MVPRESENSLYIFFGGGGGMGDVKVVNRSINIVPLVMSSVLNTRWF